MALSLRNGQMCSKAAPCNKPKNANGGAENRVVLLRRKHLRINGFSPEGSIVERCDWSDAESLVPFRLPPFPFLG
jgi:hypothetical protein